MATERIKAGLEGMGILTPIAFASRVRGVMELYRADGEDRVTEGQIRERLSELYPIRSWHTVARGRLSGAINHLMEEGEVDAARGVDPKSGEKAVVYSLTTPQQA